MASARDAKNEQGVTLLQAAVYTDLNQPGAKPDDFVLAARMRSRQAINNVMLKGISSQDVLAEFIKAIPTAITHDNVHLIHLLIENLITLFPIKKGQLHESVIGFINRVLQEAAHQNRTPVVEYICKQPWAAAVKTNNKDLVSVAMQKNASDVALVLIQSDFSIEAKPCVLTQVLRTARQIGLPKTEAIIDALARRNQKLVTSAILQEFFSDKNNYDLLAMVVKCAHMFEFEELMKIWKDDFERLVDFVKERNIDPNNLTDNNFILLSYGAYLFKEKRNQNNVLAGVKKLLLVENVQVTARAVWCALESNNKDLIQCIEENIKHCDKSKHYIETCVTNFEVSLRYIDNNVYDRDRPMLGYNIFSQDIWKYPRILICLLNSDLYVMKFYENARWSFVFKNYQIMAQAHLFSLIKAARRKKQLVISEAALCAAVETSDADLVELLVPHVTDDIEMSKNVFATVLERAAELGYFDVVKVLLAAPTLHWPAATIQKAKEKYQKFGRSYSEKYFSAVHADVTSPPGTLIDTDHWLRTLYVTDRCDFVYYLLTKSRDKQKFKNAQEQLIGKHVAYLEYGNFIARKNKLQQEQEPAVLEHSPLSVGKPPSLSERKDEDAKAQPVPVLNMPEPDAPADNAAPKLAIAHDAKEAAELKAALSPEAEVVVIPAEQQPKKQDLPNLEVKASSDEQKNIPKTVASTPAFAEQQEGVPNPLIIAAEQPPQPAVAPQLSVVPNGVPYAQPVTPGVAIEVEAAREPGEPETPYPQLSPSSAKEYKAFPPLNRALAQGQCLWASPPSAHPLMQKNDRDTLGKMKQTLQSMLDLTERDGFWNRRPHLQKLRDMMQQCALEGWDAFSLEPNKAEKRM